MEFEDRDNYQLLVNRFLNDDQKSNSNNNTLRRFQYPDDAQYRHPRTSFRSKLSTVPSARTLEPIESKEEEKENDIRNLNIEEEETKRHRKKTMDPRCNTECKQIMFLYNSKSGGQKALSLLKYFKAYTTLLYDLLKLNSSQQARDKLANDLIKYQDKLVVCAVGGDGSQAWAASLIELTIQSSPV